MAFLWDIIRSHLLLRELKKYQLLRKEAIEFEANVEKNIFKKFQRKNWISRCLKCIHRFFKKGSFSYYVIHSILAFIVGAVLTLALLALLVFQVQMSVDSAFYVSSLLAPFLCLGLAFSTTFRCSVMLIMPQLSSKRGRTALVALACIITINGPVTNFQYNVGEMAESLSCIQEQSQRAMDRLAAAIKQPMVTAMKAAAKALEIIKNAMSTLKSSIGVVEQIIKSIVGVMKSATGWLSSIVNICNRKLGTPTERCINVFERGVSDCAARLGWFFSGVCNIVYLVSFICYALEFLTFICTLINLASDSVIASIERNASKFTAYMRAALYADIEFKHSFEVRIDSGNRTMRSIMQDVRKEFNQNMEPWSKMYSWTSVLLGFTWIILFYKALHYYHKFLRSDRFDNFYMTKQVRAVDMARARRHLECVLPLRQSERLFYCRPTQLRWLPHERRKIVQSVFTLILTTLVILMLLSFDYGLFWMLSLMRTHATYLTHIPQVQPVKLEVVGNGIVPNMFRNISQSLYMEETASEAPPEIDPSSCLPTPMPPRLELYYQITLLLVLAWVLVVLEPLLLRLRPAIMSMFHPERGKQRAVWLCGHILRERGGTLRTIKRLAGRRTSAGGAPREKLDTADLLERLKDRYACVRFLFGSKARIACVVCATPEGPNEQLEHCEALGCSAQYCSTCFEAQDNICYVCEQRIHQPTIPGLELERDSSEDEAEDEEEQHLITSNKEIIPTHDELSSQSDDDGNVAVHGVLSTLSTISSSSTTTAYPTSSSTHDCHVVAHDRHDNNIEKALEHFVNDDDVEEQQHYRDDDDAVHNVALWRVVGSDVHLLTLRGGCLTNTEHRDDENQALLENNDEEVYFSFSDDNGRK